MLYSLFASINSKIADALAIIIISNLLAIRSTVNGLMSEAAPRKLATFDPIIFPILISAFPFFTATRDTTSSGNDVPKEIKKIPMTHSLTPKSRAILVPLSITKFAPPIVNVKPIVKRIIVFVQLNFSFDRDSSISPSKSSLESGNAL